MDALPLEPRCAPTLSVVIPLFNEAANIEWFGHELREVLDATRETYELVYVDDGSTDSTDDIASDVARTHPDVQYVRLARNFGKEAATSAGLATARGQAVIVIDGDGQHPPELITTMVDAWKEGYQHVVGIRAEMQTVGPWKRLTSRWYYTLSRILGSGQDIVRGATDYRLLDRELVDAFLQFSERRRMTRALLDWSGFRTLRVPFEARDRKAGLAAYSSVALLRLAVNGFLSSTLKPLYFVGGMGAVITALAFLTLIVTSINEFALGDPLRLGITGTAYIVLFVLLMVGLVKVTQGILAAYIGSIHVETQNRPLYIVNKRYSVLHESDPTA